MKLISKALLMAAMSVIMLGGSGFELAENVFPLKKIRGVGRVGRGNDIEMEIKVDGTELRGVYFYTKYGSPINLKGTLMNRSIILQEYNSKGQKSNGLMEGELGTDLILRGSFTITPGKKKYKLFVDFSKKYTIRKLELQNEFDSIKIHVPVFFNLGDEMLEGMVNSSIRKISRKVCVSDLLSKADVEKMKKENPNIKLYLPWHCNIIGEVEFVNQNLVSVLFHTEGFSGGAHGWYGFECYVFDLIEKKELKIHDLFNNGCDFKKLIFNTLSRNEHILKKGDSGIEDLRAKLYASEEDFNHFIRFVPSSLGLEIFVLYIFPHVQGSHLGVVIEWKDLISCLKSKYIRLFN